MGLLYASSVAAITTLTLLHQTPCNGDCTPPPSGLVAWWPGDGTTHDIVGTNHGVLVNGLGFGTGIVRQAFDLNGTNQYVSIAHSDTLNPTGAFSIEVWVKASPQQSGADGQFLIVDKSHGWVSPATGWLLQGQADGRVGFGFGNGGSDAGLGGFPVVRTLTSVLDDQWHHLAGVYTGTQLQIFLDAILQNTLDLNIMPAGNTREVEIGRSWGGGNGPLRYFHGLVDEVGFYSRALGENEIFDIFTANSSGKCARPFITHQPQSRLSFWGNGATFTVTASGTEPLAYQWQVDGQPVSGATGSTLIMTNLQMTSAGSYAVVITNAYGGVISDPAVLTMNPAGVSIALYAGVTIDGVVGLTYGIQYTPDLANTNSWRGLANVVLSAPTQLWFDVEPASRPQRFYRVVPGPIPIP
jgi:hypothetical protein